jgi:hypothetical protein
MCANTRNKGRNSDGLRDEFVGTRFEGSRFVRFSGHGRKHQNGNGNILRAKLTNQLDAISRCWMGSALRSEIEFEKDRVECCFSNRAQGILQGMSCRHLKSEALKGPFELSTEERFVVYEKD